MGSVSCESQKKIKLTHEVQENDDPFMRLPDDIIVSHLLSRLSLKEALRSSVLSRRWRNLWSYDIISSLIFTYLQDPYDEGLHQVTTQDVDRLAHQLADGVTRILTNYPKPTFDELVVRFEYDTSYSAAIDSWVECAFRKGVTRLELDFSYWARNFVYKTHCYRFPGIEKLSTLHAQCDMPVKCGGMSNLTVVCLKHVDVASEIIEFMLSNCPLERLCVWYSSLKTHIKITERCVKLKSLELVKCYATKLWVTSSSLVSLHYNGYVHSLCLEYVPLLSELTIGGHYCKIYMIDPDSVFNYFSQLKRLTLELCDGLVHRAIGFPRELPKLEKLEQLEVKIEAAFRDGCLLWPIVLIKAAPFLQNFSIALCTSSKPKEYIMHWEVDDLENLERLITPLRHQSLKSIEVQKFRGYPNELDLAHRLVRIPQSLEQFVVTMDRMRLDSVYKHTTIPNTKFDPILIPPEERWVRARAQDLAGSIPAGVKFVLL